MAKALGFRWLSGVLVGAVVGSVMSLSGAAGACGDEWYPRLAVNDLRPMQIARAEGMLDRGQRVEAAGLVIRVIPHLKQLDVEKSPLVARAARVLAVSLARGNGSLALEREVPVYAQGTWLGRTESARDLNRRWSVKVLQALGTRQPNDVGLQAELAEAQANLPELQQTARSTLEQLSDKDLIASPEGYATLARLRALAGDTQGERLSLARCQALTRSAATCAVLRRAS